MKKGQKAWLILLAFVLFLTSCGQEKRQAVKLIEPVEIMTSCRPLERGDIEDIQFIYTTAVPVEYDSSFDSPVTVEKIYVSVGDQVKKGDVLAKADIGEAEKKLLDLRRQLKLEKEIQTLNHKAAQLREEDLKKRIEEAGKKEEQKEDEEENGENVESGEEQPVEELKIQLAELQENTGYDKKLYDYRIQKLNEAIREQEQLIKEGEIKAAYSGQVTSIKNLALNRKAQAGECIVAYASNHDIYLKSVDQTIDEYEYQDYPQKYIMAGGKKYEIEEIHYTAEELVLARANNKYPSLGFSCPKKASVKKGDFYPVYFVKESAQNVLLVGNDSLYKDGGSAYVYVKEKGGRTRREVTTGLENQYYTEITDGLTEGELVYYESSVALPEDYEPYRVSLGDFRSKNHALRYERASLDVQIYKSEYEGELKELAIEEGSTVKKGDLLYVISTGTGKAAIAEAQNAVDQENLSYQKTVKAFNLQDKELEKDSIEKKILSCSRQIAKLQHENTLLSLQETVNRVSRNNDGAGNISVYASRAGTVTELYLAETDKLAAGEAVLAVIGEKSDLLMLALTPSADVHVNMDKTAGIGEKVSFSKGGEGVCVGYGDAEGTTFYVRMEDSDFVNDVPSGGFFEFDEYSMHDVIVLPSDMVKTEVDAINEERTRDYVWRIEKGELVRQYVIIDKDLSTEKQTVILSGLKEGDILAKE